MTEQIELEQATERYFAEKARLRERTHSMLMSVEDAKLGTKAKPELDSKWGWVLAYASNVKSSSIFNIFKVSESIGNQRKVVSTLVREEGGLKPPEVANVIAEEVEGGEYPNITIVLSGNYDGFAICEYLEEIKRERDLDITIQPLYWGDQCTSDDQKDRFINQRAMAMYACRDAIREGRHRLDDNIDTIEQASNIPCHQFKVSGKRGVDSAASITHIQKIPYPHRFDTHCFAHLANFIPHDEKVQREIEASQTSPMLGEKYDHRFTIKDELQDNEPRLMSIEEAQIGIAATPDLGSDWGWVLTCVVGACRRTVILNLSQVSVEEGDRKVIPHLMLERPSNISPTDLANEMADMFSGDNYPNVSVVVDAGGIGYLFAEKLRHSFTTKRLDIDVTVIQLSAPCTGKLDNLLFANLRAKSYGLFAQSVKDGRHKLDYSDKTAGGAVNIPTKHNGVGQFVIDTTYDLRERHGVESTEKLDSYALQYLAAVNSHIQAEAEQEPKDVSLA